MYPNPDDYHSYIKCTVTTVTPLWLGITSLIEAQKKNCSSVEEFSVKMKTCQLAGAPGACSEKSHIHTISGRAKDPSVLERRGDELSSMEAIFCRNATEMSTGCEETDCVYPNPADRHSYIKCRTNSDRKTGSASLIPCSGESECNTATRKCE